MAKKDVQSSRGPTRKQLALTRKEQEKLRILYLSLGLVGGLVALVLAFGLLQTYVFEPNSPVATVNGQEIRTGDYRKRVRYERFLLEERYQLIVNEFSALPPAEEGDQFSQLLRNQYQQLAGQILQQRSIVDRETLDLMIAEKLLEAEAAKRGISVSEDEIDETINSFLAGREGGLTAKSAEETSTAQAESSATAAAWTPTPTLTPSPTLTTTEAVTQPTATPLDTPVPLPTPTLNVIDQSVLTTQYTNWLNTLMESADTEEADYRTYIRLFVLQQKIRDAIGDEVPASAEQTRARHILVETEEEAQAVIERLDEGEEFADLAQELSTDQGSGFDGGDLGFAPEGRYVAPVEEFVTSAPIGQVSEPIESQFGWHVIEVLEREERELSASDYSQRQRAAYDDWLSDIRGRATIEDNWSPDTAPDDTFLSGQA